MNVYEYFKQSFEKGAPFLITRDGETQYTYDDLEEFSASFALQLQEAGVKPGDRIMVQVEKSAPCLFLYFACLRIGAIYLPLNTAYRADELAYFLEDAEPVLVVCDPNNETLFQSMTDATVVTLDANGHSRFFDQQKSSANFDAPETDAQDVAVILYTSGTTGRPKGAMITHANLADNARTLHEAWQWQKSDIMLHALPIFHIHGLFVATHLPVLTGCPIIFLDRFDPDTVIDCLPKATVYMGVPTNYTRLLASGQLTIERCQNMRLFTSGSAPLLAQTFDEFAETTGHQIVERYGMTETGMNTSNPLDGRRKPGTVGPPLPGVTARILNNEDKPCEVDEPGNLQVKGNNVFAGYWRKPEKTAEEFTSDGYFVTGDVASLDSDGYISIVGRDKDMIISGGLNVYPKEIESIIDRLEGIDESAIIGIPHADFGEAVCAIIVPDQSIELEANDIISELKSRIANFKVPKVVHFVESLPRNTMGKVQKNVLREQFQSPA